MATYARTGLIIRAADSTKQIAGNPGPEVRARYWQGSVMRPPQPDTELKYIRSWPTFWRWLTSESEMPTYPLQSTCLAVICGMPVLATIFVGLRIYTRRKLKIRLGWGR